MTSFGKVHVPGVNAKVPKSSLQTDGPDYRNEEERRRSFQSKRWPSWASLSPHQLAPEGFYYTGIRDEVTCFSCKVVIGLWKADDNIRERHRRVSPSCPFIKFKIEKERNQSSHASSSSAMDQHMEEEKNRLSTFSHGWPRHCPVRADDLAAWGFFYTGHEDAVQCFSCKLTLKNWEQGDTAEGEHRRHNPYCQFLSRKQDHRKIPLRSQATLTAQRQEDLPLANLQYEHVRLQTFSCWPKNTTISVDDLAEAGFYFKRSKDAVQCFHCSVAINRWALLDNPIEEHLKQSPGCLFARAVAQKKAKTEDHSTPNAQATADIMRDYKQRLASFKNWPPNPPVSIHDLAVAGFYSIDSGDRVKCYSCGGALKGWERGDTAWGEHSRHFPSCQHVQQHGPGLSVTQSHDEPWSTPLQQQKQQRQQPDSYIQKAVEMGFPEDLALQIKARQQSAFPSFDKFLEVLLAEKADMAAKAVVSHNLQSVQPTAPPNNTLDASHELKQLQESRMCKICMKKEAVVLFLPCGHILCCQECGDSVSKCPICKTDITSRIRSYFA
ncbi:E3 ubiquitin-protein ligase XIAP-like [Corticium candelabrum]|uniref:E3 ubiquitin-protein ligase XIAP-like n=1 Tax=Corticium candelabrum TaxID=121492 RepID=UPI002E252AD6|nr:E3 ubiquitin-protein ligase XIAP-like [Corticium candelabrum]